ncbi:MAG: hypothetical protein SGJ27_28135 [Candidatus Melainabacteria bacterium]|nr:hypothetical protein [Candidatus Melainabacteria bacterium]
MQAQDFEKQNQWYQNQSKDRERAQTWERQSAGENQFVRSEGGGRAAAREAGGRNFSGGNRGGRELGGRGGGRRGR